MEFYAKIYLVLMLMNIGLITFGDVQTTYGNGQTWNQTGVIQTSDPSLAAKSDTIVSWITAFINFILLGGIVGMFGSAGLPYELQVVIAVPMAALAIFAIFPIIKSLIGAVGGVVGGIVSAALRLI